MSLLEHNLTKAHLMTVLLPASGRSSLEREDGSTAPQDAKSVLLVLLVESEPAGQADNTSLDALALEPLGSIDSDGNLTTRANDGKVLVLLLDEDVTTTGGLFDGRTFQVGEVLAGKGEDGGSGLGGDGDVVGSGGFVTVGRTPESKVGGGTEVDESLDRLVRWAVLAETNGIVGS